MKPLSIFFTALIFAVQLAVGAQEMDSRKIFQSLESSVVFISDAEGGGSGIVLGADGLILTNFHVANTPLPQTVEAKIEQGGQLVTKTFSKVKLLKVHKQNDLALLKVDTEGLRLKPARISKSKSDTVAGGTCFAMGFPFVPGQEKPTLTITKGIISSAHRIVQKNPYIQLDAAINPGNSGGALVNDKGVVIGIPTLKFEGADRIGLAAPLANLKMDQFVNPEEKAGDPAEAKRLSDIAAELAASDALSFFSNPEAVVAAIYLQREALSLEPNNLWWSYHIASMYFRLEQYPLALAYVENAVKKDPKNLLFRSFLADCQELLKQSEKAMSSRMACLSIPATDNDLPQKKALMEKLVAAFAEKKDFAKAIYMLSWRQSIEENALTIEQQWIQQEADKVFPEKLIAEIMAKKSGHSVADMNDWISKLPAPKPIAKKDESAPPVVQPKVPKALSLKVSLKPGVTARLVDAPEGVTFHPETSTLEWTPAQFSRKTEVKALFLLTNPDGSEETLIQPIKQK